jgi:prepilin-type N-terminal cleavage/methylation domain-containing protein
MSPPTRAQTGFTLIELIIVAGIAGILAIATGTFIVNALNTYAYLQAEGSSAADETGLVDRIENVIRGTTSIVTATGNTLTLYAYFSPADAVVDQVTYTVSGSTLQVSVIPPTGTAPNYTYNSANAKVTTLSTNFTDSPQPVFTYYDSSGNQLATGFSMSQINQIGVYLSTNPNPSKLQHSLVISSRVTLRNMKTNL